MKNILLIILFIAFVFSGCEDLLTPAKENIKNIEQMYSDPTYAQSFLINAYRIIPSYYDDSDYATDDAVTNVRTNNYLKMATGSWTASNNPVDRWASAYSAINYINLFLASVDKVKWAEDTAAAKLFNMRMKGEAYGLRALYMFYLLRAHAGFTENGQLLGVPIINEFLTSETPDFNFPRATFDECVKQAYKDLDSAELKLPLEYNDLATTAVVPEPFDSITTDREVYNRVMGEYARQLFNGLIAKAVRAKIALLAASPAFQDPSNTATWENAADYAALTLQSKTWPALTAAGLTYYTIDAVSNGNNPAEIIWRANVQTNNGDQERDHFPPSLFGQGRLNPTQNLVDAFPMANGLPIDSAGSGYNPSSPYTGRDPRLAAYIIRDGSTGIGVSNATIYTGSASSTIDRINYRETSTRTGYYMKKRLRMDVNRNPASIVGKNHYNPRIRFTEIYLAYAEAANEAWGPTGIGSKPGISYLTAVDVIRRIRARAGVAGTSTNPASDTYLTACAADKDKMRELIRNERRLELCFESFRFWDLRRWNVSLFDLNETAKGMDASTDYSIFDVENRSYEDYMYYGPIPYSEMLKYNNLVQNKGW